MKLDHLFVVSPVVLQIITILRRATCLKAKMWDVRTRIPKQWTWRVTLDGVSANIQVALPSYYHVLVTHRESHRYIP